VLCSVPSALPTFTGYLNGAPFHNALTGEGRADREETDMHLFGPPR